MRPYVHDQTLSFYRRHQTWLSFWLSNNNLTKMEIVRGKKLTINFRFRFLLWRRWFVLMVNLLSCEVISYLFVSQNYHANCFLRFFIVSLCESKIRFWNGTKKIVCLLNIRFWDNQNIFFCMHADVTNVIPSDMEYFLGNVIMRKFGFLPQVKETRL